MHWFLLFGPAIQEISNIYPFLAMDGHFVQWSRPVWVFLVECFGIISGVVTVQDSQSGKSFSLILNLAKNVQKSPIKCLKEQNIHRKQSVYANLIVKIMRGSENKLHQ